MQSICTRQLPPPPEFPHGPHARFLAGVFEDIGLQPFQVMAARWETATTVRDGGIPWQTFSHRIGTTGNPYKQWVRSNKLPRQRNFFCVDVVAQPFAPSVPGHPGLILHGPNEMMPFEGSGISFHFLSAMGRDGLLHYKGLYQDTQYARMKLDWDLIESDDVMRIFIFIICHDLTYYF